MALVRAYFVKETTTTTGTGAYTLGGSSQQFETFAAQVGDGDTVYYAVTQFDGSDNLTDYEVGLGTFDSGAGTIARTTIKQSSNSDAAVNWSAGTKNIFVTQAADDPMIGSNNGSEFASASAVRTTIGAVGETDNLTLSGTNVHSGPNTFSNTVALNGVVDANARLQFREADADVQALTDAASITWDGAAGCMATVTLGGDRTLALITNLRAGGSYSLRVEQDGTGGRTLAFAAGYAFPGAGAPTVSSGPGDYDILTFISFDGVNVEGVWLGDFG